MNYEKDINIDKFYILRRGKMNRRPGVYIILNKINNKCYIGSSVNAKNRLRIHKKELNKNIHNNTHLQRAWNKYKENNFKFQVIMYCDQENLLLNEQEFIDKFQASNPNFGYNKCPYSNNTLGYRFTEEQKQKLSKSLKGQKAWNKGKTNVYSEEVLIKMRASKKYPPWNKGKPRTEEEKQKMSKNHKGSIAWNKGLKMPKSVGIKIAEANRKRIWTEESKQKVSNNNKGKKWPVEQGEKISKALTGHIVTEETKNKISKSLKRRKNYDPVKL